MAIVESEGLAFAAYDKHKRMVRACSLRDAESLRDFFKGVAKDDLDFELVTDEEIRTGFGDIKGEPQETKIQLKLF